MLTNIGKYKILIMAVLIAAAWRAGEAVNRHFDGLPVKEMPRAAHDSASFDEKTFYPVWVKQAVAAPVAQGEAEVDALFGKKEEPVEVKKEDYAEMFKRSARIDGVADDGVFVNGRFYKVGKPMEEFVFPSDDGRPVMAKLESIKDGKLTFAIGKDRVRFVIGAGSR